MVDWRDPGLQPERTSLAWRRTALALSVNALLILRTAWLDHRALLVVTGMVTLALALIALMLSQTRGRRLLRVGIRSMHPDGPGLLTCAAALACSTALLCMCTSSHASHRQVSSQTQQVHVVSTRYCQED
ncbi:DUF202 domain-containing protein [Ideonella azotifigens]|uniref:DUF202 domain-containing protein n=1 Tax=Ideonella azotifigens TaxID=513160 RepID=UPI001144AE6F|nr:DUF202 domain-containing protein [Ideonella azotifigens]MCD2342928.1 DUF202 domain-containing protein [Ideonella azotifigens]